MLLLHGLWQPVQCKAKSDRTRGPPRASAPPTRGTVVLTSQLPRAWSTQPWTQKEAEIWKPYRGQSLAAAALPGHRNHIGYLTEMIRQLPRYWATEKAKRDTKISWREQLQDRRLRWCKCGSLKKRLRWAGTQLHLWWGEIKQVLWALDKPHSTATTWMNPSYLNEEAGRAGEGSHPPSASTAPPAGSV